MNLLFLFEVDVDKIDLAVDEQRVDDVIGTLELAEFEAVVDGLLELVLVEAAEGAVLELFVQTRVAMKQPEALLESPEQRQVSGRIGGYLRVHVGRVRLEHELLHVRAQVVDAHVLEHHPLAVLDVHLEHVDDLIGEAGVVDDLLERGHPADLLLARALRRARDADAMIPPRRVDRERDGVFQTG